MDLQVWERWTNLGQEEDTASNASQWLCVGIWEAHKRIRAGL